MTNVLNCNNYNTHKDLSILKFGSQFKILKIPTKVNFNHGEKNYNMV